MSKRLTEKRILNITLFYLSQYESSTEKVRSLLKRRLRRMAMQGEEIPPEANEWIETAIQKATSLSYLDDMRYAENQVHNLVGQGKSEHFIVMKLSQAGIDPKTIRQLIEATETTEEERARHFAQRKRLGPYRDKNREAYREKDMAALARAGFSYDTVITILNDCND